MSRRPDRLVGAAVLAAGLLAGILTPADASPDKGTPSIPQQPNAEHCDLPQSGHRSHHDEFLSCIGVTAELSRPPAVGETATLTYEVAAAVDRPEAKITVELPDTLAFDQTPSGASVTSAVQADGTGSATVATATVDLQAGTTRQFSVTVRATATGPAQIRVRATATAPWGVDAGADDVFLTVGQTSGTSAFGATFSTDGGTAPAGAIPTPSPDSRQPKAMTTEGLPAPHSDDEPTTGPAATSCATGTWSYFDNDGVLRPSINYQVQVWDNDVFGDDLLATGLTDWSGNYNLCFDGADGEGGGQEVYVRFISSNSLWRVRDTAASDNNYVNSTGIQSICDGCTANFGSLIPGNDIHRGMHAFDSANDMWAWIPTYCWDGNDAACRQVLINWTATSTDGTYYSTSGNDVHLAADDPNAPITVVHEITHAVMDDMYEDAYPASPNCNPHSIPAASSAGCAWTEGFAEWAPASVYNDPFYRWPNGGSLNLENPTWGTAGWDSGDTVEGRVAGALIDISDNANEASWDRFSEGDPGNIWTTFQNNWSGTFAQFWAQRAAGGFNVSPSGARASVYQNTIDYTFRDPLGNYAELTRPTPTPHSFSYNTGSVYWSVVAVRPPAGADYDLALYDDFAQTAFLESSAYGGATVDFVAVDSNHRALGDYYPRAYVYSGSGNYQVELAQGSNQLNLGSETVTMGADDVVLVRDASLAGGVPTYVRVVPANSGQDPELFVMDSDPATSATWTRNRSEALASATGNGPGHDEALSFTPSASDWHGLVLINKAGSGGYTLHVDTSAPTGSVVIAGGAATTRSANVTLTHNAADANTGVEAMRVSTDGALDTEPFVPYSASQAVTLPGPDGTKTVLAQYRNGAGMVSTVVSDTIVLDRRPDLRERSISNPPATIVQGGRFTVTDTAFNGGGTAAPQTYTRYYLSTDMVKSGNDKVFKAKRLVPGLGVDALSTGNRVVRVGRGWAPGTYYLLACADGTGLVNEANESNNCIASATTVQVTAAP
ncbi:MAG: CARDB domain-containing protein [Acidimicrobiales bacterium]